MRRFSLQLAGGQAALEQLYHWSDIGGVGGVSLLFIIYYYYYLLFIIIYFIYYYLLSREGPPLHKNLIG